MAGGLASHCVLGLGRYSMTVILPHLERSASSGRWDPAVILWRRSYHRADYLYVYLFICLFVYFNIRMTCSLSTSSGTNIGDSLLNQTFACFAEDALNLRPAFSLRPTPLQPWKS